MSIFSACMGKYYDARQHQLNCLIHLRERAQEMYSIVQADSQVPKLENYLEEARLKWVNIVQEHAALAVEVRQVSKLEAEVKELKETIVKLRNVHQAKVEGFRAIHEAEVERLWSAHQIKVERLRALHLA